MLAQGEAKMAVRSARKLEEVRGTLEGLPQKSGTTPMAERVETMLKQTERPHARRERQSSASRALRRAAATTPR